MNGADPIDAPTAETLEPPVAASSPPAPPAAGSRAEAYRARRARKTAPLTATVAGVLLVLVAVVILYLATSGVLTPSPGGTGGGPGIYVAFANPILGTTTCGGTATFPTEQLRIGSLTRTFTTAQASVEVVELGDGDILPTVTARPETTLSALCTGAPPMGITWYAVLVSPAGLNLATYTYSQSWAPVPGASFPATLANDSSLTFVFSENIANQGYGTLMTGSTAATPIDGEGVL
jgi:hypothetical protein